MSTICVWLKDKVVCVRKCWLAGVCGVWGLHCQYFTKHSVQIPISSHLSSAWLSLCSSGEVSLWRFVACLPIWYSLGTMYTNTRQFPPWFGFFLFPPMQQHAKKQPGGQIYTNSAHHSHKVWGRGIARVKMGETMSPGEWDIHLEFCINLMGKAYGELSGMENRRCLHREKSEIIDKTDVATNKF